MVCTRFSARIPILNLIANTVTWYSAECKRSLENRATIFGVKYAKKTQTYTEIMYFIGLNVLFLVKMVTGLGENFGQKVLVYL